MNNKLENNEIDLKRTEDKYILDKSQLQIVKHKIETYLPPYYPDKGVIYCINKSIYFDSPDLTFLKQHLNKVDDRRKIRIRTYAPNGKWNNIYFIEIKSKSDGKSIKTRIELTPKAFQEVMRTNQIPIDADLIELNKDVPKDQLLQRAKLINYTMLINKVSPVCEVTYKRYAYQEHESLRVTIDSEIKVRPLKMIKFNVIEDLKNQDLWDELKEYGEKFYNQDNFLLEVKHEKNNIPQWLEDLIEKFDGECQGFSKYVWGMFQIMSNTLKLLK